MHIFLLHKALIESHLDFMDTQLQVSQLGLAVHMKLICDSISIAIQFMCYNKIDKKS